LEQIAKWLESEWGIPNVQYRGPHGGADNWRGHVNHSDLHPNPDGLTVPEWDYIQTIDSPDDPRKDQDVVFLEENGTYWVMGFGDYVEIPKAVGAGVALNGGAVVPIKTAERIAMGVAAGKQAREFLKKAGLV
jgi:hypothetical protein